MIKESQSHFRFSKEIDEHVLDYGVVYEERIIEVKVESPLMNLEKYRAFERGLPFNDDPVIKYYQEEGWFVVGKEIRNDDITDGWIFETRKKYGDSHETFRSLAWVSTYTKKANINASKQLSELALKSVFVFFDSEFSNEAKLSLLRFTG